MSRFTSSRLWLALAICWLAGAWVVKGQVSTVSRTPVVLASLAAPYTVGDVAAADTTTTLSLVNDVATGNALLSGGVGTLPAYGKVGLTTHVSGILPTANGGTGIAYFTAAGPSTARVYTFPDAAASIAILGANTYTADQTLGNGLALKGDTTIAHTWKLQGYDTDTGPGYVTFATVTNGTAPSLAIAPPSGGATVSVNTSTLSGLGISACPGGQTASITLSTDSTGNILFTRGSCS